MATMHAMADTVNGTDGRAARDSGIWVKEKLYYLERYLHIFSVGMKGKWRGGLYYVDLFSGPGRCRIRKSGEEMGGSPLIALKFDFAKYFFFEADKSCHEALEQRVKEQAPEKSHRVSILLGDCNQQIDQIKAPPSSLGLAFIDPTGISQITFDTIRRLTANRKIDLIINFPEGMGIRMNLHQYTEKEASALDTFMGSGRWRERYRQELTSFDQACREIANEYFANLRSLGYEVVDGTQIPVKTEQNTLLYYLLFASKDPKGNEFWRKISLIGPSGQRELFQ